MTDHRNQTRISRFRVRTVKVPLDKPHKTASGVVLESPLVLLDVETSDGVTGHAYAFVYTQMALKPVAEMLAEMEPLVVGEPLAPIAINTMLEARFRLLGVQGLVGIAIATIDMAIWDATARLAGLPLAEYLGGTRRPIRVYDSLGQMPPDETAREVETSLKRGFRAFKIKAGHPNPAVDVAVVKAIRDVAGPKTWVAVDFNQAFAVSEAIERIRTLQELDIAWIEEPVRAEDHEGHAAVRQAVTAPIQTGENWWGISDMTKSIAARASTLIMPDLMKIGGVTGWSRAAALATAHGLPVSSHLFLEYSAQLMCVTPTAHILEILDVAGAINNAQFALSDGMLEPSGNPGAGVDWNEVAIAKLS